MPSEDPEQTLRGTLTRVRFASPDGAFSVSELEVEGRHLPVTLVGDLSTAQPGESVEVMGRWRDDARFGRQLQIIMIRSVPPATREGIERYLSSGFIEGIGPVLAARIVSAFGEKTLQILDDQPERLAEVEGVGEVRLARIVRAWREQVAVRAVMIFLQSHQISPAYAVRLYKRYGDQAVEIIQQDPYRLAEEVWGIGFKKADQIARSAGVQPEDLSRLCAGVMYALRRAQDEGHMFLPLDPLRERAAELLEVAPDALGDAVEFLRQRQRVAVEPLAHSALGPAIYRASAWRAEVDAARHVRRLRAAPLSGLSEDALRAQVERAEQALGVRLAASQREAIGAAWHDKVMVLTGGPGTGKTTIVRAIVSLGQAIGARIALAAPTGRAARRLADATGAPASTLHRLLEFSFQQGGFQRDEARPLAVDMLIVDEASMIDTTLLHALARALPDEARLVLVGDVDQLPSVGAGQVLRDVIASGAARVVRLGEIFRQAQTSHIVLNAHRINRGKMPELPERESGALCDFYMIQAERPEQARATILRLVTERIPSAFGLDPIDEVQVLSPMHRGEVGCGALNTMLQQALHGDAPKLERGQRLWRLGDKVMQTRNDYERDVFNGDMGRLIALDHDTAQAIIRFEGREVSYDFSDLDDLTLAYAVTVHKSQGSEYPAVIVPVMTQHYVMLQRNLLYTAVTRAKRLVILVGTSKALSLAVDRDGAQRRYTRLDWRLSEGASLLTQGASSLRASGELG